MGGGDGLGDAAAGGDVVFLDQEGVVEADAVVVAAAAGDRVFLRQTQAGQGLAGVEQFHAGAFHQVGVVAGAAGGAGEQLQEVQCAALAAEQGAGRAVEGEQGLVGRDAFAVADFPFHLHLRVELAEYLVHPGRAGDGGVLAGDDAGGCRALGGDQLGGDVAAADVLGQGGADVGLDFPGEVGKVEVRHLGLLIRGGGIIRAARRLVWGSSGFELFRRCEGRKKRLL
ncbi:hypothetical protein D9M71_151690 [compost metagenome]